MVLSLASHQSKLATVPHMSPPARCRSQKGSGNTLASALTLSQGKELLLSTRCMGTKELDRWKANISHIQAHWSQQTPGLERAVCLGLRGHWESGRRSTRNLVPGPVLLASCPVFKYTVGVYLQLRFSLSTDPNMWMSQYLCPGSAPFLLSGRPGLLTLLSLPSWLHPLQGQLLSPFFPRENICWSRSGLLKWKR